jgi:anti-anti-sigma factor
MSRTIQSDHRQIIRGAIDAEAMHRPPIMNLSHNNMTGELKISGTLDIDSANPLREVLLDCFQHQPEVAADLSEVDGCDAAALQVLLAGRSEAAARGKVFRVSASSQAIRETAAALGFSLGEGPECQEEDAPSAA